MRTQAGLDWEGLREESHWARGVGEGCSGEGLVRGRGDKARRKEEMWERAVDLDL